MPKLYHHSYQIDIASLLLPWFYSFGRALPWRVLNNPDPYHVWLSEMMLQQTTVTTVKKYFETFINRWPTVHDLAGATLDQVLHAWQGLGYYARARNLHACALKVVQYYQGQFPTTVDTLEGLPGIGPYSASAIAAIAFQQPASVVDTNIERVVARLFALTVSPPKLRRDVRTIMNDLVPTKRPGDFVQALMDLGAMICTPKQPLCLDCPLSQVCQARHHDMVEAYPVKIAKSAIPKKYGVVFWLQQQKSKAVLLRRRPLKGLLAGMIEIPSTPWRTEAWVQHHEIFEHAPVKLNWHHIPGSVRHRFTHFDLELQVVSANIKDHHITSLDQDFWCLPQHFNQQAFPTLMKKVINMLNPALLG